MIASLVTLAVHRAQSIEDMAYSPCSKTAITCYAIACFLEYAPKEQWVEYLVVRGPTATIASSPFPLNENALTESERTYRALSANKARSTFRGHPNWAIDSSKTRPRHPKRQDDVTRPRAPPEQRRLFHPPSEARSSR